MFHFNIEVMKTLLVILMAIIVLLICICVKYSHRLCIPTQRVSSITYSQDKSYRPQVSYFFERWKFFILRIFWTLFGLFYRIQFKSKIEIWENHYRVIILGWSKSIDVLLATSVFNFRKTFDNIRRRWREKIKEVRIPG